MQIPLLSGLGGWIEMGACVSRVTCCCRTPRNGITNETTDAGDASHASCFALCYFLLPVFPFLQIIFLLAIAISSAIYLHTEIVLSAALGLSDSRMLATSAFGRLLIINRFVSIHFDY